VMKSPSILEKFNVKLRKNAKSECLLCFQQTRNFLFNWNMDNFMFNFLSQGQLESLHLSVGSSYLYSKYYHAKRVFAIIARMLCENHLNIDSRWNSSHNRTVRILQKNLPWLIRKWQKSFLWSRMLLIRH